MMDTLLSIARSWCTLDSDESPLNELQEWVRQRNETIAVSIRKIGLEETGTWFYEKKQDAFVIRNTVFFRSPAISRR